MPAIAARTDMFIMTKKLTLRALTPERIAAFALPPTA
ncbi:Uncharacterised protein [Mycobacteroides abscessus subsp. abscessus]|nr:Uncharacterised protein [Mycobacteroides abscessus subsp. abscessus]